MSRRMRGCSGGSRRNWIAAIALACACTPVKSGRSSNASSIVEDASVDAASAADAAPDADGSSAGGSSAKAGNGPAAGSGGNSTPAGGSSAGSAATAAMAGSPAPAAEPAAGSGGAPSPILPSEVRGRVIDFYQRPAESVQVTIGDTSATSGRDGEFSLPNIAPQYDATVLSSMGGREDLPRLVFRFEGLTRRDPTLQITDSPAPIRSGSFRVELRRVQASRPEGDVILTSYSAPDRLYLPSVGAEPSFDESFPWRGPNPARITAHAIRMLKLPGRIEPTDFYAYARAEFDLTDGGEPAQVVFDLPNDEGYLSQSTLLGTLERPPGTAPIVEMYLRFADHGMLPLVTDSSIESAFSYFFPTVPGSSVTLVAAERGGTQRVVHIDGITATTGHITLRLPDAPLPASPPAQSTVDASTPFQWSGTAKVYLFVVFDYTSRDGLYVITAKPEARLPTAPSYDILPNHRLGWRVQTHGSYASVDEATGATGYLDTCAFYDQPQGPSRGTGTFASSVERVVMTR